MKKLLFALMIVVLAVSAVACMGGGNESEESESLLESVIESVESEPESEEVVESTPESVADGSKGCGAGVGASSIMALAGLAALVFIKRRK